MKSPGSDTLAAEGSRIVQQVTGHAVTSVIKIKTGVMTVKYAVETVHALRYVVRFYPPGRESVSKYEAPLLVRMRERGMLTPDVIAQSASGPAATLTYVAYRMIPGISMQDRLGSLSSTALLRICRTLLSEMEKLAGLPIVGFGEMLDGGRARHTDWKEFVRGAIQEAFESAAMKLPMRLKHVASLIEKELDRFGGPRSPVLSWGDVSPENIILGADDEIVGLVDFEGTLGAEPVATLGYLRARYEGTSFCNALEGVWKFEDDNERIRGSLYVILRALRIWPYMGRPLPAGSPRDPIEEFLPGLERAGWELLSWMRG